MERDDVACQTSCNLARHVRGRLGLRCDRIQRVVRYGEGRADVRIVSEMEKGFS